MNGSASAWAASELAEFVVRLSAMSDPDEVLREAVDGIAEALDAEAAALVLDGRVVGAIGWPAGRVPEGEILRAAERLDDRPTLDVPGAGPTAATATPLDRDGGVVLVARVGDPLKPVEVGLLSAMGRTARMALDSARLFRSERQAREEAQQLAEQRRRLLEDMISVNEAKDDFLSMTSHELRTPLTSILGFVETLRKRPDLEERQRKQALDVIERQARRLQALVADLLDVSAVEAGGVTAALELVDVVAVLGDLGNERLTRHAGDLVLDLPEAATALVDPAHLRRIAVNLVANAVKYGLPPVEVTVATTEAGVEVSVRDHGPGVPEEFRARMFDKFTQASTGSRRQSSGTGLGLAIARGLAEANDAELRYEDAETGGARFVLSLRRPT